MERLLARSRTAGEPTAPAAAETPAPAEESDLMAASEEPPAPPKVRTPVDADKIRREVVSFREVALMSARSAVATSKVKAVRNQVIAKGVATLVGAAVSVFLLASPIWSRESFVLYGAICLLITGGMGYLLFDSFKEYRRIAQLHEGQADEPAAETNPADTVAPPAPAEAV